MFSRPMRTRLALISWDVMSWLTATLAVAGARYDFQLNQVQWSNAMLYFATASALIIIGGVGFKFYLGRYKVASFDETVALAVLVAGVAILSGTPFVIWVHNFPNGIAFLTPIVALIFMESGRLFYRAMRSRRVAMAEREHRALIYGAGEAGTQLVRLIQSDASSPFRLVGIIDDAKSKKNLTIAGVPVVGNGGNLLEQAEKLQADTVILAVTNAPGSLVRRLQDEVEGAGLSFRALPPLSQLYGRSVQLQDVRRVKIEDVLGRGQVKTDIASIADYITGKRVLVTGAGGSIGSELARQVHRFGPAELIMLDRDESGLQATQLSIFGKGLLDSRDVVLSDIRDEEALRRIFADRRPEVVFHTAALKHLPMLEQYPQEGWKTNVLGTLNLLRLAEEFEVGKFINISTDKAADPTSVLGLTKRLGEQLTAHWAGRTGRKFISVRFGNVLGSRGSMLHAFNAQIDAGGPLTVTHPEIDRFFMTIAEACELVIQSGAIGSPGEVLVLDMGEPIKILDVAKRMIAQSGKDVQIIFTGLRPGEKMHEVLMSDDEVGETRDHPLIMHVAVPPLSPEDLPPMQDMERLQEEKASHD